MLQLSMAVFAHLQPTQFPRPKKIGFKSPGRRWPVGMRVNGHSLTAASKAGGLPLSTGVFNRKKLAAGWIITGFNIPVLF